MKLIVAGLLLAIGIGSAHSDSDFSMVTYLREHSQTPVEYMMIKATSHRITIIGEAHWLRQDVDLVTHLITPLQKADIDLAVETLNASEQSRIDELIAAPKWIESKANAIMRAGEWPYEQYRGLLRAAWFANQGAERRLKILAIGPPPNWREVLLPKGSSYEQFMADLVTEHHKQTHRRVVVYCGSHHAFTRYYQAELDNAGKARAYMDRMGNILSRRFGDEVFLISLHKPIWCGSPAQRSYCLPFGGRLDCAAAKLGRPVGFDVVGTPVAELRFEPADYYTFGHPGLRFGDYTDGYIWSGPIESFRQVTIIPLSEYAPDQAALAQVASNNPFNNEKNVSVQRLEEIWRQKTVASRDILAMRGWKDLAGWQSGCEKR